MLVVSRKRMGDVLTDIVGSDVAGVASGDTADTAAAQQEYTRQIMAAKTKAEIDAIPDWPVFLAQWKAAHAGSSTSSNTGLYVGVGAAIAVVALAFLAR